MIHVDLTGAAPFFGAHTPDYAAAEAAHRTLSEKTGAGSDFLGWTELPRRIRETELARILAAGKAIREKGDALVVVGIGGSYLGARAAYELIGRREGGAELLFAGNGLSAATLRDTIEKLGDRDFCVNVVSKSGTTLEPALATRSLRWLLERRYGTDGARERIYVTTDRTAGALRTMAESEKWESFVIPRDVGGRYSVLSAVGLLPMAVAGIDISAVLAGGSLAREELNIRSFENPAWQYAASRYLLAQTGKQIELLCAWEPDAAYLGRWWQQLFGESEGKEGKGLFPAFLEYSADLHSMGQMVQQGRRNLFETILTFDPPQKKAAVELDWKDLDGLNYLDGKTLDFVERQACAGVIGAHVDGGVPIITIDAGPLDAHKLGELFYFFELSCALSAYMLGVNPFDQPGVEAYKENMFRLLGRPEK